MPRRNCPICGTTILGRSDKKFCSANCKNKFHLPSKSAHADTIKTINRFLFQNYKIMESIFEGEKGNTLKIPRLLFNKMGFHFDYCTGYYINSKGKFYHYIYDYAWMEFSNQELMIVRKKKNAAKLKL